VGFHYWSKPRGISCGAGADDYVRFGCKIAVNVPQWIFHGEIDDIINPWPDRSVIKASRWSAAKKIGSTRAYNIILRRMYLLSWICSMVIFN
ncbi:hypothetical protein ACFP1I_31820, partial [Dyadobacter subterraneus]|uniref:hypothetical protein n=1 Tax=Dyadobacter subterraneus TaxID=2773304 RepID=UPI0036238ED8